MQDDQRTKSESPQSRINNPNLFYDFAPALKAATDYCSATGIACRVIDKQGKEIGKFSSCPVKKACLRKKSCPEKHLKAAFQAEHFGGRYIYFCDCSFTYWVSPLLADGAMAGAMIAGPSIILSAEDVLSEWQNNQYFEPQNRKYARKKLKKLSFTSPKKTESLMSLLFAQAVALSDHLSYELYRKSEIEKQQSMISAYLQGLKQQNAAKKDNYPLAKERQLIDCVQRGNEAGALMVLREIMASLLYAKAGDKEYIGKRSHELMALLSRSVAQEGGHLAEAFSVLDRFANRHELLRSQKLSFFRLVQATKSFCQMALRAKNYKHRKALLSTFEFVDKNYMNHISLEDVANQAGYNHCYFSKIFNKEAGENFNSYLNRKRVERSKVLLRDTSLPLIDISGLVGFEDQSYFTKVFKKYAGISPGRYRLRQNSFSGSNQEIHQ